MKIGLDISQIVYDGTGVSRFTHGLTEAILKYGSDHQWVFFFSRFRKHLSPSLKKKITATAHASLASFILPPRLLSFIWNDLHILPVETFTGDLDWFISSDWTEPPATCKKATIIHDLVFKKYPETVHPQILHTQEKRVRWIVQETHRIFSDSQTTALDLQNYYDVEKKRITTIYPGVAIQTPPSKKQQQQTKQRYQLENPYVLSVGKQEPRKNMKRLITVYQKMIQEKQIDPSTKLLIVGPHGWGEVEHDQSSSIRFLGFIPDSDLYTLYQSAECLVFPSMYEGFGYPAVEAMLLGCPVIMSNSSSLAEIGRDGAAALFDPSDELSMSSTIGTVLNSKKMQNNLREKGKTRARDFTWKNYYDRMIEELSV